MKPPALPPMRLTKAERTRLADLERTIQPGIRSFEAVGRALLEIQRDRLYREDFSTWEHYLHERWGISRSRGYQLVTFAQVEATVHNCGHQLNEAQARELAPLEPDQRQEVWEEAHAEGKATAAQLRERVNDIIDRMTPEQQQQVMRASEEAILEDAGSGGREEPKGWMDRLGSWFLRGQGICHQHEDVKIRVKLLKELERFKARVERLAS